MLLDGSCLLTCPLLPLPGVPPSWALTLRCYSSGTCLISLPHRGSWSLPFILSIRHPVLRSERTPRSPPQACPCTGEETEAQNRELLKARQPGLSELRLHSGAPALRRDFSHYHARCPRASCTNKRKKEASSGLKPRASPGDKSQCGDGAVGCGCRAL